MGCGNGGRLGRRQTWRRAMSRSHGGRLSESRVCESSMKGEKGEGGSSQHIRSALIFTTRPRYRIHVRPNTSRIVHSHSSTGKKLG